MMPLGFGLVADVASPGREPTAHSLAQLVCVQERQIQICMTDLHTLLDQQGIQEARQDAVHASLSMELKRLGSDVNTQLAQICALEAQMKRHQGMPPNDRVDILVREVAALRSQVAGQETHKLWAEIEQRHRDRHNEIGSLRQHVDDRLEAYRSTAGALAVTRASAEAQQAAQQVLQKFCAMNCEQVETSASFESKIADVEARLHAQVSIACTRASTEAHQASQEALQNSHAAVEGRAAKMEKVAESCSSALAAAEARLSEQILAAQEEVLRTFRAGESRQTANLERQVADRITSWVVDAETRLQSQFSAAATAAGQRATTEAKQLAQDALRNCFAGDGYAGGSGLEQLKGLRIRQEQQDTRLADHEAKIADMHARVFGGTSGIGTPRLVPAGPGYRAVALRRA